MLIQSRTALEELKALFSEFRHDVTTLNPVFDAPLRDPLVTRVLQAIDEGIERLESEQQWLPRTAVPQGWSADAFLIHWLEGALAQNDERTIRWLVVAYGVVLANFRLIQHNLERLAVSNLNDLTWLVAGALWVQWGSGQPTTAELRETLLRIQAMCPQLDAHLRSVLAGPPGAAREAAEMTDRL